ncbi:hypothetical protein Trydic_g9278 [Trypoxylus dichotomus]
MWENIRRSSPPPFPRQCRTTLVNVILSKIQEDAEVAGVTEWGARGSESSMGISTLRVDNHFYEGNTFLSCNELLFRLGMRFGRFGLSKNSDYTESSVK